MNTSRNSVSNSFGDYCLFSDGKTITITYADRVIADHIVPVLLSEPSGKYDFLCKNEGKYGRQFDLVFEEKNARVPEVKIECEFSTFGITLKSADERDIGFTGCLSFGKDASPCTDKGGDGRLYASCGPAVRPYHNGLFDRETDRLLRVAHAALSYDHALSSFCFSAQSTFSVSVKSRVLEDAFGMRYRPLNKNTVFKKPPAGFMTWYAVKFDASEGTILRNTRFQEEHLKPYGADTVWVDWEWYHSDLNDKNAPDSVGFLSPEPNRYPHGLAYLSDEIRAAGFVPALWIGPTVEPAHTETVKKYEEAVMLLWQSWCGQYYFDITDERIRDEWIPYAVSRVREWGYDALKWDCLLITLMVADQCRDHLKHPEASPLSSLRALIEKGREAVGDDFFMSAVSSGERGITGFADLFEMARVGEDIFAFDEFISSSVEGMLRYYPLHNNAFYCDADNLVLRDEFNTPAQARSRAAFVSLLGLPATFGDDLPLLPAERLELLQRTLPTMDVRAGDLTPRKMREDGLLTTCLAISAPFEEWDVVSVFNTKNEAQDTALTLNDVLHGPEGEYHVYEFFSKKYLGCFREKDKLTLALQPCETKVLQVRKKGGRPQIVTTSRHITGGQCDLKNVCFDESTNTLTVRADTVAGESYRVTVFVPEGYAPTEGTLDRDRLMTVELGAKGGEVTAKIKFEQVRQ